ncbi:hypothetical protein H4R99_008547, partial [Coemansia sp. RSA 1722]
RKLGMSDMERKSAGVVYGPAGTLDLKRCCVIQGTVGSDSPTPVMASANNGSFENTPSGTPPRVDSDAVANQTTARSADQTAPAALNADELCLWDLVAQMANEEPAPDAKVRAAGTLTGFIGLNHVDRTSRRAQHHERAIKIN